MSQHCCTLQCLISTKMEQAALEREGKERGSISEVLKPILPPKSL